MHCSGTVFQGSISYVTPQFKCAPGVVIMRLAAAKPLNDWNNYADCPAYGSSTLVYSHTAPDGSGQVAAFDGKTFMSLEGARQGQWPVVDPQGVLAYWGGENPDGSVDLYGTRLDLASGLLDLSNRRMRLAPPCTMLVTGTSCYDRSTGKIVIPFSDGNILHRSLNDGTVLPDIAFADPYAEEDFHRLRLNPVFPWLLWYKRDAPGANPEGVATPAIYVADLRGSRPTSVDAAGGLAGDHNAWSPDGTRIAFIAGGMPYVSTVADAAGNLLPTIAPAPIKCAAIAQYGLDYLIWTPDGKQFLCSGGYKGGSVIYFMSADGGSVSYVLNGGSSGKLFAGLVRAQFAGEAILFASDALTEGMAQIYLANGYAPASK